MDFYTKKITPEDIFITILKPNEMKQTADKQTGVEVIANRASGNEFIDKVAQFLYRYRMNTTKFYEERLGLRQGTLHSFMILYTGLSFPEWRNRYLMLAAKELLKETDLGLKEIGPRLGFSGMNTFSRWFIRTEKTKASWWRYRHKK